MIGPHALPIPTLHCDLLGYHARITIPDAEARAAAMRILRAFRPAHDAPADASAYAFERTDARWTVSREGASLTTDTSLSNGLLALEWQLITDALDRQTAFFHLHGAALATPDGQHGLLIVGDSGSGKTTLVLALMQRGFLPYSDDVALIEPDSLRLHPFPRAFHVREGTRVLLEAEQVGSGPPLPFDDAPPGFFLPPRYASQAAPVRFVFFPTLRPTEPPQVVPLAPAESATMLLSQTLTLARTPAPALATAARLTAKADCVRLFTGNLAATIDLVLARIAAPLPATAR